MPNELKNIRAILFDLDGILYDFKQRSLKMILIRIWDFFCIVKVKAVRWNLKGIVFEIQELLYRLISEQLAYLLFLSAKRAKQWYCSVYNPHFTFVLNYFYRCRNSVPVLLRQLRVGGYLTVFFSDYSIAPKRLTVLGLDSTLFDGCWVAKFFDALKPAVRSYLAIVTAFTIPPEQVLVVGDRSDTDSAGALASGMHFIQIRIHKTHRNQELKNQILLSLDKFVVVAEEMVA